MVLSVSEKQYEEFQKETKVDPERQAVLTIVKNEWPDTKQQVPLKPRPYWTFREEAARGDGLLFKGTHLIALKKFMRPEMLRQIHKSHLGIAKCTQRAREVLFWPGMSVDVQQMVTTVPPSFPWQKIGTDLFELQGEHYLLSECYRSKFPEVTKMESLRSSFVAQELTRQFGAHGTQRKWSQIMAPTSAAVNSKNLRKSTASSMSPVPHTIRRLTVRWSGPFRP